MARRGNVRQLQSAGLAGKIFVTLFLSIFVLAGLGTIAGGLNTVLRDGDVGQAVPLVLVGGMFLLIPSIMLIVVWKAKVPAPPGEGWDRGKKGWSPGKVAEGERRPDGSVAIKPQHSPLVKLAGISIFALIWNGFIGGMMYATITQGEKGALFCLSPFALVGLVLVFGVFYQLLAMFNPRPQLVISTDTVRIGHTVDLAWQWQGRVAVLERLEIHLVGTESATYRRGTTTTTDTEVFLDRTLLDTTDGGEIRSGTIEVEIPFDTMHSLDTNAHDIAWKLKLQGHIARWPDVIEEFPILVLPVELVDG